MPNEIVTEHSRDTARFFEAEGHFYNSFTTRALPVANG